MRPLESTARSLGELSFFPLKRSARMVMVPSACKPAADGLSELFQTENRLKKLIRIWRALHEYVNFVHDPEKQYRSLSEWSAAGVLDLASSL